MILFQEYGCYGKKPAVFYASLYDNVKKVVVFRTFNIKIVLYIHEMVFLFKFIIV